MEDLKLLLFKETKARAEVYGTVIKARHADHDMLTQRFHAAFCALYSLIEEAGLTEEYEEWKQAQQGQEANL